MPSYLNSLKSSSASFRIFLILSSNSLSVQARITERNSRISKTIVELCRELMLDLSGDLSHFKNSSHSAEDFIFMKFY